MAVWLGGSGAVMAVHGTEQQVARLGRAALRRLQQRCCDGGCSGMASGEHQWQQCSLFFLFPNEATPSGLKPAVMVRTVTVGSETGGVGLSITNELNPTPPKPAVIAILNRR